MIENETVRRDFSRILERQTGIGDAKIISNWFLEPPNVFDPNPRKRLKPCIVIGLLYIVLMAAACAAFNLG